MKLIYNGPHDGVEVPLADGRVISALRGVPANFPDEVGKSLLEQETWEAAETSAPKTKKAQKAEEE